MLAFFSYLERENGNVLEFHMNNFSYFEISTSLFSVSPSNKYISLSFKIKEVPACLLEENSRHNNMYTTSFLNFQFLCLK